MLLSEIFKNYEKELKNFNLSLSDLDNMGNNYIITLTQKTFEKLGRKSFPIKPTEDLIDIIPAEYYVNYLISVSFFHDRIKKAYTFLGFIPVELACISPDKQTRIVRQFKIERK